MLLLLLLLLLCAVDVAVAVAGKVMVFYIGFHNRLIFTPQDISGEGYENIISK